MSGALRIERVRLSRVKIPLATVYVSSMYVMPATWRTVIEVEAGGGLVGLGETLGTDEVFRLTAALASRWIGHDPLDRRGLTASFARSGFDNRAGRNGWSALGGLELALWDLAGRAFGVSVSALLGGATRERVELVCPIPAVAVERPVTPVELDRHQADLGNVDRVADWAEAQREQSGFGAFKYKSTARSPAWDEAVMRALRARLGAEARLRFDPNGGYPPVEAIRLCDRLEELDLEFFEDPTDDLEGLARLRRRARTPVATNMAVVEPAHLPAAIRRKAVDVVLADVFMWGGVGRWRDLVAVADGFGLEVGVHSLFETGVATALNLHLAAAHPSIRRANDSGLHLMGADVTTGLGPIANGALGVPTGPGLGVTLDRAELDRWTVGPVTVVD